MDGERFDNLTRTFANGTSRRSVLKGLAAGLATGLTGWQSTDARRRRNQADPNGANCVSSGDCISGHCVDGVCCDSACTGQCEACSVDGVCQPVTGQPRGNRPACSGSGACAGSCDGVQRTSCTVYPGPDTTCSETTCAGGWLTTYACSGNGVCAPHTISCAPYVCQGNACSTGCTFNGQCAPGTHCTTNCPPGTGCTPVPGVCVANEGVGTSCTQDSDCQLGICIDGICCTEQCGPCEICNLAGHEGYCNPLPDGSTCGSDGLCCEGDCIAIQTDVRQCGACGHVCPSVANALTTCVGGTCGVECLPGFKQCAEGEACIPNDACCSDTDCSSLNDVCAVGKCNSSGACIAAPRYSGGVTVQCPTDNPCTIGVCIGAECVEGNPKDCSSHDTTCREGFCDSTTGECTTRARNNGGSCDDGNLCTPASQCSDGHCEATASIECLPDNECRSNGFCNSQTGTCVYTYAATYSSCGDGGFCCHGSCCNNIDEISCQDDVCSGSGAGSGEPCPPQGGGACRSGICEISGLCQ